LYLFYTQAAQLGYGAAASACARTVLLRLLLLRID
jgi:hypothetical protein